MFGCVDCLRFVLVVVCYFGCGGFGWAVLGTGGLVLI